VLTSLSNSLTIALLCITSRFSHTYYRAVNITSSSFHSQHPHLALLNIALHLTVASHSTTAFFSCCQPHFPQATNTSPRHRKLTWSSTVPLLVYISQIKLQITWSHLLHVGTNSPRVLI